MGSELFYIAYMDLSSCRSHGATLPGPIPWSEIHLYCEVNEITGCQREDVFYHVQRLDKWYLDWSTKRYKKQLNDASPKVK